METENGKMSRTGSGIRAILFDEIDALRNGSSKPERGKTIALLAMTILKSIDVEIEFHKYARSLPKHDEPTLDNTGFMLPPTETFNQSNNVQPTAPGPVPKVPPGQKVQPMIKCPFDGKEYARRVCENRKNAKPIVGVSNPNNNCKHCDMLEDE